MYKIMIADDEEVECRTLEHKIKNMDLEITILPSACDGVSLVKNVERYRPDIAIVDINMPGLSGLESIEVLQMKKIDLVIIINSAYSDFSYMQKALQLGATDYLLKPSGRPALEEALRKAIAKLESRKLLKREREKEQTAAGHFYDVAGEKWLLSLLLGEQDEKCYEWLLESYPDAKRGGIFAAWKLFGGHGNAIQSLGSLGERILECCRNFCNCIGVEHRGIYFMFLIPEEGIGEAACEQWAIRTLTIGINRLKKEQIEAFVSISRLKQEKEQFVNGIREIRIVLQGRDTPGIAVFHYHETRKVYNELSDIAAGASRLLAAGKLEECIISVRERISSGVLTEDTDTLKEWKVKAAMLLIELEQNAELFAGEGANGYCMIWGSFSEIQSVDGLLAWVEKRIRECYRYGYHASVSSNEYVTKALIYIYENYTRDISLEETAQAVGISYFYLSRLLKQEKNTTFVEILTDTRVRKAIRLMKENEHSIKEISALVGYSNLSYFYKVLKKTTGFTAGDLKQYF